MLSGKWRVISGLGIATLILVSYNNCADQYASDSLGSLAMSCEDIKVNAFGSGYYPFLTNNSTQCGFCHREGGKAPGVFAGPNFAEAFADFDKRGYSKIGNFATDPTHKNAGKEAFQPQVDSLNAAWEKAEQEYFMCKQLNDGVVVDPSATEAIAKNIFPSGTTEINYATTTYTTLSWNLNSELMGSSQFDGTFSIEVRWLRQPDNSTSYEIRNPRLTAGPTADLYIKQLHMVINAKIHEFGTTFITVDATVPKGTAVTLSTGSMIVAGELSVMDTLGVKIGALKIASAPIAAATFSELQATVFGKCMACHGAARQDAALSFASYEALMGKAGAVVPNNAATSTIVTRSALTTNTRMPPPPNAAVTAAELERVRTWINAGALNN